MRRTRGAKPKILEWEDYSQDLGLVEPAVLIEAARKAGLFVFDLETSGLSPRKDRIEGVAFYVPARNGAPALRAWYPFVPFTFLCHLRADRVLDLEDRLAPIGVDFDEIREQIKDEAPDELVLVDLRPPMDQEETMEKLRPIWEELLDTIDIAQHRKFDDSFLYYASGTVTPIEIKNIPADAMLADFVADERHKRYGLKFRVKREFGHQMTTYAEAVRGQTMLAFCNAKPLGVYAMDDCYWTYRHHQRALSRLRKQTPAPENRTELRWSAEKRLGRVMGKLERIYWGIDTKISQVLMEMENSGVLIDWQWLRKVEDRLTIEKEEISTRMEKFLGWPLNPNSGEQVADALFAQPADGLGLPMAGIPIGKSGTPSTADRVIKHFARFHPLVADILKWRSLDTILSGFVKKLIKLALESPNGRVYSGFNQTRTVIARLSSSRPINFQNQPRDKNLVRKGYCAYREGIDDENMRLFGADYGQIELRVAAHLAKERNMIEVYSMGGICTDHDGGPCNRYMWDECHDCDHCGPAPEVAGVKLCFKCKSPNVEHQARCRHVDLHQRTAEDAGVKRNPLAKNLNFGLLYRMGAPKFCVYADLFDADGMPMVAHARELITRWHKAYPGIDGFHQKTEWELEKNDWIAQTIFGRRRRLDEEARLNRYRAVTQGIQFKVSGCVVPETPILTESGYVPINQLAESGLPIFDGAGFTSDYSVVETSEKEVFEVKLSDGRTLTCSGDHRLAGMDSLKMSWPKVKELRAGDLVATHDVLAPQGDSDHGVSSDEAYLVGALIGDGYYGDSRGFVLAASARDPGWPESLDASVRATFGSWIDKRMRWGLRNTSRGGLVKDLVVLSSRARKSLMILGLDCVSKQKKRIPDWVYTAPPEVRGACLAGLVDTDGSILSYKQGNCITLTVNYSSRVKHLVDGAWRLASSLGIDSAIRSFDTKSTSKKGGIVKQYRLDITYRGMQAFRRWVPLRHPRKAATLEGALSIIAKKPPRRKLPTSFVQAVAALADAAPIMVSRQGRSLPPSTDCGLRRKIQGYIGHARNGNAGENMVAAILDYIEEPGAKEALQLGWVAIESITSLGVRPTYDIEIHGENHAYIANGFLTHNSAQDIMKAAMILIFEERNQRRANARPAERKLWNKVKILLQIHDELILEGPKELTPEITELFKRNMESVGKGHLLVPLAVTVKSGKTWDDIH